jgi:hypothetical protein
VPAPGFEPGRNCGARLFAESYLFDEVDAIRRRNFVSYGITTRILGRFGDGPVETAADEAEGPAIALDDEDDEDDAAGDEAIDTIDPDTLPQPAGSGDPALRGPAQAAAGHPDRRLA